MASGSTCPPNLPKKPSENPNNQTKTPIQMPDTKKSRNQSTISHSEFQRIQSNRKERGMTSNVYVNYLNFYYFSYKIRLLGDKKETERIELKF
jgi:hypothetical protein